MSFLNSFIQMNKRLHIRNLTLHSPMISLLGKRRHPSGLQLSPQTWCMTVLASLGSERSQMHFAANYNPLWTGKSRKSRAKTIIVSGPTRQDAPVVQVIAL